MSERRNAWGRGPDGEERATVPASLADDQRNRFDQHQENINKQRRNTDAHDKRVAKHAQDNERWLRKNFQPVAVGGTRLTPDLAKRKVASDASRNVPATAPISIDVETVVAIVRDWKISSASGKNFLALFEQNDWNREQLSNATQYLLRQGHPVNAELPEAAFQLCYRGNHLDPRKRTYRAGNVVHLRGEARRPAPVPFPRTIWPDEAAAIEREEQEKAAAAAVSETARAKSLTFDELRGEVTKARKPAPPLMGPMVS